jgi:hypothetical protein
MVRIPWEGITLEDVVPEGFYRLRVEDMVSTYSSSGKLMVRASFLITDDNEVGAFKRVRETFTLGTDDDPNPNDCSRQVFGVERLIKCFLACNLPRTDDLEVAIASAIGRDFDARVYIKPEEGEYSKQNRIGRFDVAGTMKLGVTDKDPDTPGGKGGFSRKANPTGPDLS